MHGSLSPPPRVGGGDTRAAVNGVADSLLSKHNGWITIDQENADRKQAPETFQITNPM